MVNTRAQSVLWQAKRWHVEAGFRVVFGMVRSGWRCFCVVVVDFVVVVVWVVVLWVDVAVQNSRAAGGSCLP